MSTLQMDKWRERVLEILEDTYKLSPADLQNYYKIDIDDYEGAPSDAVDAIIAEMQAQDREAEERRAEIGNSN